MKQHILDTRSAVALPEIYRVQDAVSVLVALTGCACLAYSRFAVQEDDLSNND